MWRVFHLVIVEFYAMTDWPGWDKAGGHLGAGEIF